MIVKTKQAIQSGATAALAEELKATLEPGDPPNYEAFVRHLLALLHGEHRPRLAEDPALDYVDAVELGLLAEGLGRGA